MDPRRRNWTLWYYAFLFVLIFSIQWMFLDNRYAASTELTYKEFKEAVAQGKVEEVVILPDRIVGLFRDTTHSDAQKEGRRVSTGPVAPWRLRLEEIERQMQRQFFVNRLPDIADPDLLPLLERAEVTYSGRIENNFIRDFLLNWILPILFFVLLWALLIRRLGAMGGPSAAMQFGKNKARIYAESPDKQVTFKDVAGIDEAVEEVKELVDFLKNPQKYSRLGGKMPKGVLLVGPPGTGKTLLARAIAGEAGVPFFHLSGSDFMEMFVGVGAARVRDLFQQTKAHAPCIVFIDEIDAIGKKRGSGVVAGGGYDERENTLNQLLVEMDGFDSSAGVLIIGATNRPEVLDPALLRPGRFDRQILVDRPDLRGREAIFRVHTRRLKLGEDVDLHRLAAQTPGFAGAEIANVCNEAALLAVRNGHERVMMSDFEQAIERVIAGLEKKNKLINPQERRIVAYHESGHAIVGYFTPGAEQVQKVSIVPRGIGALGYTLQMPLEDRYLLTRTELLGKIKGLLGGRAAEELAFGEISTGASNDLERVYKLARDMVTVYGMSPRLRNLNLTTQPTTGFLAQEGSRPRRSEKLEERIDEEIQRIVETAYEEAKALLAEKYELLEAMAQKLLEREVLDRKEIEALLGPRPAPKSRETPLAPNAHPDAAD